MVTWLSVVVLNVDLGLAIGVVFSMMTVICRTQRFVQTKKNPFLKKERKSEELRERESLFDLMVVR